MWRREAIRWDLRELAHSRKTDVSHFSMSTFGSCRSYGKRPEEAIPREEEPVSSDGVSDRGCGRTDASPRSPLRRGRERKRENPLSSFLWAPSLHALPPSVPLLSRARLFKYAARRNRAHDWHIKSLSPCVGRATRLFLHPRTRSRVSIEGAVTTAALVRPCRRNKNEYSNTWSHNI